MIVLLALIAAFTVHGAKPEDLATLTPEQRALYDDALARQPPQAAELDQLTFELMPIAQEVLPKLEIVRASRSPAPPVLMVRSGDTNLFVQDRRKPSGKLRFVVDTLVGCPLSVELEVQRLRARLPTHTWKAEQELRHKGCVQLGPMVTEALLTSDVAKDLVPVLVQLADPGEVVDVGKFTFVRKKDAVTARGSGSAGGAAFTFELHADEDGWKLTFLKSAT